MAAPWSSPDAWRKEDIFALSRVELEKVKLEVAKKVQCKYKGVGTAGPFAYAYAQDVGGTAPFTEEAAKTAIKKYLDLINNKPVKGTNDTEEQFKAVLAKWTSDVARASTWTTVINGCQLSWLPPNGPWNQGYIMSFAQKFESGDSKWDITLDRKAGGVAVSETMDLGSLKLVAMNSSSLMGLIMLVVFHVVQGEVPEHLKQAFTSLKVTWCFSATSDEIIRMSIKDNIDQHLRKRHTEFDNINYRIFIWAQVVNFVLGTKLNKGCLIILNNSNSTLWEKQVLK